MKTLLTPTGAEIKIFTSAKEIPIERFSELQKYLAKESNEGSSMEGLSHKLERIKAFIFEGDSDSATKETNNALFCLNNVLNGVNYYSMAFACLVSEIGYKVPLQPFQLRVKTFDSIDVDSLKEVINLLIKHKASYGMIKEEVIEVKKKSIKSWSRYFRRFVQA